MKHILVDYENIQPATLASVTGAETRVVVFLGPTQTKVCSGLVKELQAMGHGASYEQIEQAGPNALDFVLAFRAGEIAANDASAEFLIVSHDGGYDALICHLRKMGRQASRTGSLKPPAEVAHEVEDFSETGKSWSSVREIGQPSVNLIDRCKGDDIDSHVLAIVSWLKNMSGRPGTIQTLTNHIQSSHPKVANRFGASELVAAVISTGFVLAGDSGLIYHFNRKKKKR